MSFKMIIIMNTNNIIKVNIHVFNRFTNKNEIVKVSIMTLKSYLQYFKKMPKSGTEFTL